MAANGQQQQQAVAPVADPWADPPRAFRAFVIRGLHRWRIAPVHRWLDHHGTTLAAGQPEGDIELVRTPYDTRYYRDYIDQYLVTCQVLNLFYVGPIAHNHHLPMPNDDAFREYWEVRARRQFGAHVCLPRSGLIESVFLNIVGTQVRAIRGPISQMYPTVRRREGGFCVPDYAPVVANEEYYTYQTGAITRHCRGTYQLTVGLRYDHLLDGRHYTGTVAGVDAGERYYVRTDQSLRPHRFGRVYELTGAEVATRLANARAEAMRIGSPVTECFAIYVCAGAKLVVLDEYNTTLLDNTHNRTLVQQGGVVIVEGELQLRPPTEHDFGHFNWTHIGQGLPLNCEHNDVATAVAAVTLPVLFLAPNESEYGSIAWELILSRDYTATDPNGLNRTCLLTAPEGGRLEAVLDWDEGAVELAARHSYERLYDSCVQMNNDAECAFHEQTFQCPPDVNLMWRILTNRMVQNGATEGPDRTVTVDIDAGLGNLFALKRPANQQPLPVLYNCHRVVNWLRDDRRMRMPPPMPPYYPAIQYAGAQEIGYNIHVDKQTVDYKYDNQTHRVAPDPHLYRKLDDTAFELALVTRPMPIYFGWRQPIDAKVDWCDGVHEYLGIDGWIYMNVGPAIGQYESQYYKQI